MPGYLRDTRLTLPAIAIVFFLTRVGFSFWPIVWPDEALFSSPAADLAIHGTFTSPVLYGLIPGMDVATLWNSPLYMVLLSVVYGITGESLIWGRALSLFLAVLVILLLNRILYIFTKSEKFRMAGLMILALDPVFLRSANTIRMDMLTLFFVLLAFYFLIRYYKTSRITAKDMLFPFLAGIATGLGGMSHPFAVILLPVILVFLFPAFRAMLAAGSGVVLGFLPWLFYILQHPGIFHDQFIAQLDRKKSMFTLWGGDTGGIFKVFLSQYGGGWFNMVIAFLGFSLLGVWIIWSIHAKRIQLSTSLMVRLLVSIAAVLGFVLISSEGWYALYVTPLLLIIITLLTYTEDYEERKPYHDSGFTILAITLFLLSFTFYIREIYFRNSAESISTYLKKSEVMLASCNSIYLRTRPDPYFRLKRRYPEKEILEFVPGKLNIQAKKKSSLKEVLEYVFGDIGSRGELDREKRYNEIQCFFVDDNGAWEPYVTDYLLKRKSQFTLYRLEALYPAFSTTLWMRKKNI